MPEEDKEKEAPKKKSPALEKMIPVLIILSIGLAFMVGTLWQKVQSLEKGVSAPQVTTGTSGSGGGDAAAPAPATTIPSFKAAATSPTASVTALSISFVTCSVPPLTNIVTAFGFLQSIT